MAEDNRTPWEIRADYLQACNCDFGCPCEFQAPPTMGFCDGAGVWRINQGKYGEVSLDGLAFGFAAHWPGPIHLGNGTVALFFDEKAQPAQREALFQIVSGQAGGLPFEILVTTFTKILEPQYVPFQIELKGRNSLARAGDAINIALEPILNPVTKEPEGVRVEHETGFVFKSAECVAAREGRVAAGELNFSYPGRAGFVAQVHYHN